MIASLVFTPCIKFCNPFLIKFFMKRLKKIKLNEKEIINRLSNGEMKHLLGGYSSITNCLAGCGCNTKSACVTCSA